MDGYYWPPDSMYGDYSSYYPHVYRGLQPWPNQTGGAEAQGRASVHPEGSPSSQALSAASSGDESDGQVSSIHNSYNIIYPER